MTSASAQSALKQLFSRGTFSARSAESESDAELASNSFVDAEKLGEILSQEPFDLQYVQDSIEKLIAKWRVYVHGKDPSVLFNLKYRIEEGSELAKRVDESLPKSANRKSDKQASASAEGAAKKRALDASPSRTSEQRVSMSPSKRHKGGSMRNLRGTFDSQQLQDASNTTDDLENKKPRAKSQAELHRLREERNRLGTTHGDDPIAEAVRVASRLVDRDDGRDGFEVNTSTSNVAAVGNRGGGGQRLYDEKKSAQQVKFDTTDESESEDDESLASLRERDRPIRLGALPITSRPSNDFQNTPGRRTQRQEEEEGAEFPSPNDNVVKRRFWTREEKQAVKQGVERYGMGDWSRIKAEFAVVLRHRTNVQIKDCWRTMIRRGEV
jgi:Myb-like DNA-binding domain